MDTKPDTPSPAEPVERPIEAGAERRGPEGAEARGGGPPAALTPTVVDELPAVAEKTPGRAGGSQGSTLTPTAADELPAVADKGAMPREKVQRAEAPATVRRGAPRKRRWVWAVVVLLGVLVGAAVAVVLLAPGYLKARVVEEARARGVLLAFADAEYGLSKIVLRDVSLGLSGVPDFRAKAGRVEVDLEDYQPRAVRAGELSVTMTGTDVLAQLGAWKAKHGAALSAPLSARGASVDWHPLPGVDAGLSLLNAAVDVDAEKGTIDAADARMLGRAAGPTRVTWTTPTDGFVVEIRPGAPPLSAVSMVVTSAKEGPRLKLVLARTALRPLQAALGVPAGSEGIEAEGEIEMPVPSLAKPAPIEATVRMSVKGYVPPHPKELDGILFGDVTKVSAKAVIAADFSAAKLSGVAVEAGALSLSGTGNVAREGLDARVSLKLTGSIPCTALATSAAVAHLGAAWGRLAGGLAAGALQGSVSVALSVEALASDIKGAKIDKSARLGCKVSLPGLPLPSIIIE